MKRESSIFWGLVFVLGAAAILLNRFGYLGAIMGGISIWSLLLDICIVTIFLKGILKGSFGQILFSAAFLIIVNNKLLHLEAITPWPVLGAALLGTVGLNMLFPNFGRHKKKSHGFELEVDGRKTIKVNGREVSTSSESNDGDHVMYDSAFCSSIKYVTREITQVSIDNAFGLTQVYFVDATLKEGSASVTVDTAFGKVILYVPSGWEVDVNTVNCMASTTENGKHVPDGSNILYVRGDIAFGGLEIVYV